jgi:hypothetical protein
MYGYNFDNGLFYCYLYRTNVMIVARNSEVCRAADVIIKTSPGVLHCCKTPGAAIFVYQLQNNHGHLLRRTLEL